MTQLNLLFSHGQSVARKNVAENIFRFFVCLLYCIDQHGYTPFETAVNDKLMLRSPRAAQHGFAVNDSKLKSSLNSAIFSGAKKSHAVRLLVLNHYLVSRGSC